jgi:prepilin-type N-terminal cleavage/methylation domain-containing protein
MGQEMIFVILSLIYPVKRCDWLHLTMKRRQNKTGVTLVEILVVVAIIAILVTMVIGIAARIDTQGKEQLTENTIALLTAALGEFGDYGYSYSDSNYADFKFPLDCNNFPQNDLENELQTALGAIVLISGGTHDANYSGSETLYFFLSRVPESRQTLDKIDRKLVTNLGLDGNPMKITINPGADEKKYPLFRVIDPWGKTLRYDYYDETKTIPDDRRKSKKTFPVITSSGPDKEFGSADDIRNR